MWHFTGKIARAAFEAANGDQAEELPEVVDEVQAVVTLVNDRVVRAIRPVLESDNLPYRVFNWRRRAGHWAGVGVGEQVQDPAESSERCHPGDAEQRWHVGRFADRQHHGRADPC